MAINGLPIIVAAVVNMIFDGIKIGVLVWFGFVAASTLAPYLFEGRPIKLYFLYKK